MPSTFATTDHPATDALVDLVATAESAGDLLVSSSRLVDALLDVRSEVPAHAVPVVDDALAASAHRQVIPTAEAVDMAARVSRAWSAEADLV